MLDKSSRKQSKVGAIEMELDLTDAADPFQEIMERAGNHGRFQMIYNIIFIMGLGTAGSMCYMNIILALNVPDHWCTVAGRELTNYSLQEWREITLPVKKDNRGKEKFSDCEMYDVDFTKIEDWTTWNKTKPNSTVCQNGWSYDQTWYDETIPTKSDWVCSKDMYVTNVFVLGRIIEVVGCFILGQMGDVWGRRIIYYISVFCCSIGRLMSIVTATNYTGFMVFSAVAYFSINSLFQSPQIVGMEISREEDRTTIATYQSFGWSFGTTTMPLLFWYLRHWKPFMWITSMPTFVVLIFSKYAIESPRWLISKQRYAEAITQFKKIAKINGRKFDMTEKELAQVYSKMPHDVTYGLPSLFSGWRLARNTTIMGFSWCVVAVSYFTLVLNSSHMGGNPNLNFLMQSIVEIPAYPLAKYITDNYGRRFTNSGSFLLSFVISIPVIILSTDEKHEFLMMCLCSSIKFLNAMTFFAVNLQSMEIYPTTMRQTGISLGTILANAVGILAPFLIYLGDTIDIRAPFYILSTLFLLGGIAVSFLPETLHRKLPDTIEEARQFGAHDKFFSLPKDPAKRAAKEQDNEKLNQQQYAP